MGAERVFVGLGANLGDARATLQQALDDMANLRSTDVVASSSFYRTAPVEAQGPDFVNAVAELRTTLEPEELLQSLQKIEADHGRKRPYRNAPRTLDLDLLLYGERVQDSSNLTLPHPRAHLRAFVLQPLAELAPNIVLPGQGVAAALAATIADQPLIKLS